MTAEITFKEELEARLRLAKLEVAKLMEALAAYEAAGEADSNSADGSGLDHLTIKEATLELLNRAWAEGKESLTVGELQGRLRHYKVRSSRKNVSGGFEVSEAQLPRLLIRALTAPDNRAIFKLERAPGSKRVRPRDMVSLAKPPARKK